MNFINNMGESQFDGNGHLVHFICPYWSPKDIKVDVLWKEVLEIPPGAKSKPLANLNSNICVKYNLRDRSHDSLQTTAKGSEK